ncbi:MAG: serine hydrolase domain-containing protein [Pseudomonadota bacterium]
MPPPKGALTVALARVDAEGREVAWLSGRQGPDGLPVSDSRLRMRVASVTKMALARTVLAAGLDPETPVSDYLDWPGAAPAIGALMSHISGLSDEAGYIVAPPESPEAFVARHPKTRSGPPGFFRYSNLGYLVLACALERATGRRLDHLMREHVLDPAGIGGGLNWSGVADRDRHLPLWQWQQGRHVCTIDGADTDWAAEVVWRNGQGVPLSDWQPGHAAWFSPQGGLRVSVLELARLVRFCTSGEIGTRMMAPRWRFDGSNGMDGGGLFRAVGLGMTLYEDHPEIPSHLAGHAGHALGVSTGAWLDRTTGTAWAYAINGWPDLTEGLDDEVFYPPAEAAILRAFGSGSLART